MSKHESIAQCQTIKIETKAETLIPEIKGVAETINSLPPNMMFFEALDLPIETRLVFVQTLLNPDQYKRKIFNNDNKAKSVECMTTITFTDNDLQLGPRLHNRPLHVSGLIREHKISRILIDGGSAVNIMPICIMKRLGVSINDLTKSKLTMQGFNQKGQRALGTIHLKIEMGELISTALFHIIDSRTSYELLLRCV